MTSNKPPVQSRRAARATRGSGVQQRFRGLVERIEEARAQLRAWDEAMPPFLAAYEAKVRPLLAREHAQVRAWVLALDRAALGRTWSRKDRLTLRQLLVEHSQGLLAAHADDAELTAVFRRHGGEDYTTWRQREIDLARKVRAGFSAAGTAAMGRAQPEGTHAPIDPPLQAGEPPEEDWAAAHARAEHARAHARAQAREARARAAGARATQSLRETYRKLVSELHPDREPDEARQRVKTVLMQAVNDAYERKDLQALLAVQTQLATLDAGTPGKLDDATLKRHIAVLSQQAHALEQALHDVARTFMQDYGMAITQHPDPRHLDLVIDRTCRHVRAATRAWAAQVDAMHHTPTLRAWLAEVRRQDEARDNRPWDQAPDDG